MATNAADTSNLLTSALGFCVSQSSRCVSFFTVRAPILSSTPLNLATAELKCTVIFGLLNTRCCIAWLARNVSRRWKTVTPEQIRDNTSASSIAVSPPPMTAHSLPLNKKPSQVAQPDTPCPRYSYSPAAPSHRASDPVAIMTECALIGASDFSVEISKGLTFALTLITESSLNSAAKLRA